MATKNVLRKLNQSQADREKRREEAREEVKQIKESVFRDLDEASAERDLPEHDALVTKHHLRHARRVQSAGRRLGETVDRLPIHQGEYHQKGHRDPKKVEFEAPLLALVAKYGPDTAGEHFSLGQHQKYERVVKPEGSVEYWNVLTGQREYPEETVIEAFKHRVQQLLREIE